MGKDEWICPECERIGTYQEIRRIIDLGVDCCPDCRCPVECIDDSLKPEITEVPF